MTRCFIVALVAASTSFLDVCILSLYCTRLASMCGQQSTIVVGSCKRTSYAQTVHLRVFLRCMSTVCNRNRLQETNDTLDSDAAHSHFSISSEQSHEIR